MGGQNGGEGGKNPEKSMDVPSILTSSLSEVAIPDLSC